jgi:hypothetical protein
MREIQTRLQAENPSYRRIWVQYSHHRAYRVVITLFPQGNGDYQMIFGEVPDLSYESINNVLRTSIVN